jgi:hypothetical protein
MSTTDHILLNAALNHKQSQASATPVSASTGRYAADDSQNYARADVDKDDGLSVGAVILIVVLFISVVALFYFVLHRLATED